MSAGLMRGLHYGILSNQEAKLSIHDPELASKQLSHIMSNTSSSQDEPNSTAMPESWVRGSILIRANSLSSGASGIRPVIVETLLELLNKDVVPRVPLRGSISASGDLSPMSYIAGVMQGKPAVDAYLGGRSGNGSARCLKASQALVEAEIRPVILAQKEGLAMVNGTATSASVAALAIHDAMLLLLLSQILTAMSVEALCGTDESFHPFFSKVRPHPGQVESASNILHFLSSSKLVEVNDGSAAFSQRQDRYSIRTAPQWLGPSIEDILLSYQQVSVELNSVTDNPLFDENGKVMHGGNFQAKCLTHAMEKTRQCCQSVGQMLFAQCTELINPDTSRGLAPNLVVDEPNESWMWKGTDIMVAALQSELGFLANPVGSHVQSAEMGNQALNSLALISARYTHTALETLSQLAAAHLVALCQALDLRAINALFKTKLFPIFEENCAKHLQRHLKTQYTSKELQTKLWDSFFDLVNITAHLPSPKRFKAAIESLYATIIKQATFSTELVEDLESWGATLLGSSLSLYKEVKSDYLTKPDATPILGLAAQRMYLYVRNDLQIPFFADPLLRAAEWELPDNTGRRISYTSMGGMITAVYDAIRSGALFVVAIECLKEVEGNS